MNVESFSYVLLTTVVGMAIVFLFLVVLSLLMVVIRAIFDDKPAPSPASSQNGSATDGGSDGAGAAASAGADQTDYGVPRWVVAAALAYLSEEEREYAPRASGWTIRSTR